MILRQGREPTLAMLLLLSSAGLLSASTAQLSGRVVDENGNAVAGVVVTLTCPSAPEPLVAASDASGRFVVSVVPGTCDLKADKRGYYASVSAGLTIPDRPSELEVILIHVKEFEETVNVVYSAPVIDPQQTESQTTLTAEDAVDIPYPSTHDFRNALPLMPVAIKDNSGRIHLNGAGENQIFYSLDGFNITNPVSGIMESRIAVDALRTIQVQSSRYSAEYGKGSAGALALETSRGDDRFRFLATNFIPSFENHDGLMLSNWMPRATISGPIVKGRAWYFNAIDLQYDSNVTEELPSGANTSRNWFGSNLTVLQANLTRRNILTSSALFNFQDSVHWGMSPLDPLETTRDRDERFYFLSIKDQAYFEGGWVLETGLALSRQTGKMIPMGAGIYTISPQGRSGNYFVSASGMTERIQGIANVLVPTVTWSGRHGVKFGVDVSRIGYRRSANRRPYEIRRLDGTLVRSAEFVGPSAFERESSEFGAYVQDRWTPIEQLVFEAGLRLDWDQILRQTTASPRIAATYSPRRLRNSKFSAGVGIYHDAPNLSLLLREMDQQRIDTIYAADGITVREGPAVTRYVAAEHSLAASYSFNWSLGWEQQLPRSFYLRSNFIRRHAYRGWFFEQVAEPAALDSGARVLLLRSNKKDSYSFLEMSLHRRFWDKYDWFLSYIRSGARTTAVMDYSLENPVFGPQAGGPLDWDAPNRLISWALLPAPRLKKFSIAYFLEWHTGFPFSIVNECQQIIGPPNSFRFPDYFSLNLHVERRFRFLHYEWAFRAGFNNVTGHRNPDVVNNSINSPDFLQFIGGQGRVLTGRIRLLGKG
ncbi:MAG: TonB-dependent receptor [Acidobacteria bacterium]|nr:TonB-dependent receptor [Acidobacteriota bacterium]